MKTEARNKNRFFHSWHVGGWCILSLPEYCTYITDIVFLFFSADGSDTYPFGHIPVLANNMGQIYWFPPTHIVVKCDLDLKRWPSDEHTCMVRLGSWAHHGEQIDLQILATNDTDGVRWWWWWLGWIQSVKSSLANWRERGNFNLADNSGLVTAHHSIISSLHKSVFQYKWYTCKLYNHTVPLK